MSEMITELPIAERMLGTAPFYDFATLRGLAVGFRFRCGLATFEVTSISPHLVGDGVTGVLVAPVTGGEPHGEPHAAYLTADGGPDPDEDDD